MALGKTKELSRRISSTKPVPGNPPADGEMIKTKDDILHSPKSILTLESQRGYISRLGSIPAAKIVAEAAFLVSKSCGPKVSHH